MRQNLKSKLLVGAVLGASALGLTAPQKAMAQDQFVGQLGVFGNNFCPRGWAEANGQLLPIAQNTALFSLLGTFYGGDGRTTFGVPNLQGRLATHEGNGPGLDARQIGQVGGTATTTMTAANLPSHSHSVLASDEVANKKGPGLDFLAKSDDNADRIYYSGAPNKDMDPNMLSNTGSGQSAETISPYIVMTWCVALQGTYPSRN